MKRKQQATASGEDYLEAILVIQMHKGAVRSVDIARHMEVSKPSVCHAVNTLKNGGFLIMDDDHFLHLTDVGREVAEQTYEKHCFFTRLLVSAGVDPKEAECDACRMEHAISESSFQQLKAVSAAFEESKEQTKMPRKDEVMTTRRRSSLYGQSTRMKPFLRLSWMLCGISLFKLLKPHPPCCLLEMLKSTRLLGEY